MAAQGLGEITKRKKINRYKGQEIAESHDRSLHEKVKISKKIFQDYWILSNNQSDLYLNTKT